MQYVSEWKNNRQWDGAEYDKNGNIIATYSKGVAKPVN